jgi:hypothetical protein
MHNEHATLFVQTLEESSTVLRIKAHYVQIRQFTEVFAPRDFDLTFVADD